MKSMSFGSQGKLKAWTACGLLVLLLSFWGAFPARADDPTAKPADQQFTFSGKVTDREGKPLAQAKITAWDSRTSRDQAPAAIPVLPDGSFSITRTGKGPWTVSASEPQSYSASRTLDASASDLDFILGPGATIEGVVIARATGKPIANAELTIESQTSGYMPSGAQIAGVAAKGTQTDLPPQTKVKTDDRGRYQFEHLPLGFFTVQASGEGYANETGGQVQISEQGVRKTTDFFLVAGAVLTGVVRDSSGKPVAKAYVSAKPQVSKLSAGLLHSLRGNRVSSATTDDKGQFSIVGLAEAPAYFLQIHHENFAPLQLGPVRINSARRADRITAVLTPGASLTARLVLPDGSPYLGPFRFNFTYSDSGDLTNRMFHYPSEKAIKKENNRVTINLLPAGKTQVIFVPVGAEKIVKTDIVLEEGKVLDLGDLPVTEGPSIRGKVVDEAGQPVDKCFISAEARPARSFGSAECDAQGEFILPGLKEGVEYQVHASASGKMDSPKTKAKPGTEPLIITLQNAGELICHLVTGDPPRPITTATFQLTPNDPNDTSVEARFGFMGQEKLPLKGEKGVFHLPQLKGRRYDMLIHVEGLLPFRKEGIEIASGQATDLGTFELQPGVTVTGRVVERGTDVPIAGVEIIPEGQGLTGMVKEMVSETVLATSRQDGTFTIEGVGPGKQTIKASHSGFADGKLEFEIVPGAPSADLILSMGPGGTIEGTFRLPSGAPAANAAVMVMSGMMPNMKLTSMTDAQGHFRIEHVTPGAYMVIGTPLPDESGNAGQPDFSKIKMTNVSVEEGKTVRADLPPEGAGIRVHGTLRRGRAPLKAGMVWVPADAAKGGPKFEMGESDANGQFSFQLPGPGRYHVQIIQMGKAEENFESSRLEAELSDQPNQTKDLTIPLSRISGSVTDGSNGLPLPGTSISVWPLERKDDSLLSSSAVFSSHSDEKGEFVLTGIPEGSFEVMIQKSGFASETLGPIKVSGDEAKSGFSVTLFPANALKAFVFDEQKNPIPQAAIFEAKPRMTGSQESLVLTSDSGEAQVNIFKDGSYDLAAVAPNFAPTILRSVAVGPEARPVVFTLERGFPLTIQLVDNQGKPFPDAQITITNADGINLSTFLIVTEQNMFGVLNAGPDGRVKLNHIAAGTYEIEAKLGGKAAQGKVTVGSAEAAAVKIKFE